MDGNKCIIHNHKMDLDFFILDVGNFEANRFSKPNNIRLILGTRELNLEFQKYSDKGTIDVYQTIGSYACILNNYRAVRDNTEIRVFSLLLSINYEESYVFLKTIKDQNLVEKLIEYLYYKFGIIMINRLGKSRLYKNLFNEYNVTDILIFSKQAYKRCVKYIMKKSPNLKVGIIPHPSKQNWGEYKENTFLNASDALIENAVIDDKKIQLTSLKNFRLDY